MTRSERKWPWHHLRPIPPFGLRRLDIPPKTSFSAVAVTTEIRVQCLPKRNFTSVYLQVCFKRAVPRIAQVFIIAFPLYKRLGLQIEWNGIKQTDVYWQIVSLISSSVTVYSFRLMPLSPVNH
jgi:hypothetical protein